MKKFVINLDRRLDKQEYVLGELTRVGMTATRYSAIDTKPGWVGCALSHIACMEQGKNDYCVTVFEDDIKFLVDCPQELMDEAVSQLPKEWDMISWGTSPQEPLQRYSENLFRLNKKSWCMHAYTINNNNGLIDLIVKHKDDIGKIDVFMSKRVYPVYNCFLVYPLLCTQVQFQSDTCKRSDVSTIEVQYNKNCYDRQ